MLHFIRAVEKYGRFYEKIACYEEKRHGFILQRGKLIHERQLIDLFNIDTFVTFLFSMLTLISREKITDKFYIDRDGYH